MKKRKFTYDAECLRLAAHFLQDSPLRKRTEAYHELAQLLQDTIESWLIAEEAYQETLPSKKEE